MNSLFTPLTIGDVTLSNRIIMSPLTRCRAVNERIPNDLMVEYYTQRATAGLILSEATAVTPMGVGYPNTPGIWSEEQVEGWKKVTESVHKQGGKIFLQLWHVGRISDPYYLNGELPVSASAIAQKGHVNLLGPKKGYETPRALEIKEIKETVESYRKGAANAKLAGFDGVEIHGANGYLIDQFLQDGSNIRTDEYGGSIENRARFLLEVTDAVISVWGPGRVGLHIAPRCDGQAGGDSNPTALFSYVAEEMKKRKIAFLCAREYEGKDSLGPKLKEIFGGVYISNEQFTKESAENAIKENRTDAVAFGKTFIANPDLVKRFKEGLSLNEPNPSTFYVSGKEGYTDYPFVS
ncbi:alkene reductase [Leptospira idonii]|uniref:Alkene reductase n=1 Tax=Leptospira idonii TaxID=1193500 RepID=A0A4R9LVL1_9LEPT|nr:alkene reductase [Leptospira idonii]TGN18230.1 alkene reductase [Leptospira idonii]